VTYDREFLYVRVRCHKPLMGNLVAAIRPGAADEDQVVTDDCIELYLDPGRTRRTYVRLVVNPNGAHKVTGHAKWKWACGRETEAWVVEVAAAWSGLSAQPKPAAV